MSIMLKSMSLTTAVTSTTSHAWSWQAAEATASPHAAVSGDHEACHHPLQDIHGSPKDTKFESRKLEAQCSILAPISDEMQSPSPWNTAGGDTPPIHRSTHLLLTSTSLAGMDSAVSLSSRQSSFGPATPMSSLRTPSQGDSTLISPYTLSHLKQASRRSGGRWRLRLHGLWPLPIEDLPPPISPCSKSLTTLTRSIYFGPSVVRRDDVGLVSLLDLQTGLQDPNCVLGSGGVESDPLSVSSLGPPRPTSPRGPPVPGRGNSTWDNNHLPNRPESPSLSPCRLGSPSPSSSPSKSPSRYHDDNA